MTILTCKNHPSKPANKMCKKCGAGLCKYCQAKIDRDSRGEPIGYICYDCEPEQNRGIMQF